MNLDRESYDLIKRVPWLNDSISPTGVKWGRRIADVKMSRLPQNLLGMTLVSDTEDWAVIVVIFRWDRNDHLGWSKSFPIVLTFPGDRKYEIEIPQSSKLEDGHSVKVNIEPGTILRERVQQVSRMIPRVIFNLSLPLDKQPSQEVRRLLKNVRRMTNLVQCTSLYLILEDDACRKEVEASGIPNFLEAYSIIRSGSYRADLLRYYLLYRYGGVYLDDKTFLRHCLDSDVFDTILEQTSMFIGVAKTAEIAFIGARRGCPIMLEALTTAIKNIMRREYFNHRLEITGNYMLQKILERDGSLQRGWGECMGEKILYLSISKSDEKIIHQGDILWQRQAIPSSDWPRPATHYSNLWAQRMIYTEGNPEVLTRTAISAEAKREILAYTLFVISLIVVGFLISRYPPISWI